MSPKHVHRVFEALTLTRNSVHVVATGFAGRFRIALSKCIPSRKLSLDAAPCNSLVPCDRETCEGCNGKVEHSLIPTHLFTHKTEGVTTYVHRTAELHQATIRS